MVGRGGDHVRFFPTNTKKFAKGMVHNTLTSNGRVIDQDPTKFGRLRESSEHAADGTVLRERLSEDGYVFLRNVLDKQLLLHVREVIADELHRLDAIDPDGDRSAHLFPARPGLSLYKVADNIGQEERRPVTRQPALHAIFHAIFGEKAKPLDYSWPRIAGPGRSEQPHCDWVYMRRRRKRLYTAWIPLMDLPLSHGPLMVLENSHHDNPTPAGTCAWTPTSSATSTPRASSTVRSSTAGATAVGPTACARSSARAGSAPTTGWAT